MMKTAKQTDRPASLSTVTISSNGKLLEGTLSCENNFKNRFIEQFNSLIGFIPAKKATENRFEQRQSKMYARCKIDFATSLLGGDGIVLDPSSSDEYHDVADLVATMHMSLYIAARSFKLNLKPTETDLAQSLLNNAYSTTTRPDMAESKIKLMRKGRTLSLDTSPEDFPGSRIQLFPS